MEKDLDIASLINNMKNQIVTDHVTISSLKDLLIKKEVFTKEELDARFELAYEEESGELHDFIETEESKV